MFSDCSAEGLRFHQENIRQEEEEEKLSCKLVDKKIKIVPSDKTVVVKIRCKYAQKGNKGLFVYPYHCDNGVWQYHNGRVTK